MTRMRVVWGVINDKNEGGLGSLRVVWGVLKSMVRKLDGRRGIKKPLTKKYKFNHDNGYKISCIYINARSIKNKFEELKPYVNLKKHYIFIMKS